MKCYFTDKELNKGDKMYLIPFMENSPVGFYVVMDFIKEGTYFIDCEDYISMSKSRVFRMFSKTFTPRITLRDLIDDAESGEEKLCCYKIAASHPTDILMTYMELGDSEEQEEIMQGYLDRFEKDYRNRDMVIKEFSEYIPIVVDSRYYRHNLESMKAASYLKKEKYFLTQLIQEVEAIKSGTCLNKGNIEILNQVHAEIAKE